MIRSFRISNFKAFGAMQEIPIRPITLIFGANSAGKSSIIHSLALAHEAAETGELDVHRTRIGGRSIDLGGFRQYIHRHELGRQIEWTIAISRTGITGRLAELLGPLGEDVGVRLSVGMQRGLEDHLIRGSRPFLAAAEILGDGDAFLRLSGRPDGSLALDRIVADHPVIRQILDAVVALHTTTPALVPSDLQALQRALATITPRLEAAEASFLPRGIRDRERPASLKQQWQLFTVSRGNRERDLEEALAFHLPLVLDELVSGVAEVVSAELGKLRYLGPLRSHPGRHLAFTDHDDLNWYAGGGYAWDVVRREPVVRDAVNRWLGDPERLQSPFRLQVRRLVPADRSDAAAVESLAQFFREVTGGRAQSPDELLLWLSNREEGDPGLAELMLNDIRERWDPGVFAAHLQTSLSDERLTEGVEELTLVDPNNLAVSHRDVGIGVSQVLPVLVNAYAEREKLIAIEQPEIHLHPALQAELGDVFLESALGDRGNTFLLETHSEHILLRIMRRMRETAQGTAKVSLTPNDVCLLFVDAQGGEAHVTELRLDAEGVLLDPWPGGFFEEGYRERFAGFPF